MPRRSGARENLPYSLSRWTDVPAAKWDWFRQVLADGEMIAFDPRTAIPSVWSLKPEETLGLNFWTKDPSNLLADAALLRPFNVKVHVTLTGWEEVEKGAPDLFRGADLYRRAMGVFGRANVIWRFSPVPLVDDVVERFATILGEIATDEAPAKVYLAFLQENDLLPETRNEARRRELLVQFAKVAERVGTEVLLCNDDRALLVGATACPNLSLGVCAGPADWGGLPPAEGCGCAIMIDPFTINESCTFGCAYCYAADKTIAPRKHSTTRHLPVGQ